MSYNITTFKLKELKDFSIKISDLYISSYEDWHPKKIQNLDGTFSFSSCESEGLRGNISGESLNVTSVDICGEGSGTNLYRIFEPAFKRGKGILIAACIWEGGDEISLLKVRDGELSWEEIEI
jgi:hypothetical protein